MEGKLILEGISLKDFFSELEKRNPKEELLTHEEVRKELKIGKSHYARLKKSGLLPVRGLGTLERIFKSELLESMDKINKYLEVA